MELLIDTNVLLDLIYKRKLEKRMDHVMIPAIVLKAFCCEL